MKKSLDFWIFYLENTGQTLPVRITPSTAALSGASGSGCKNKIRKFNLVACAWRGFVELLAASLPWLWGWGAACLPPLHPPGAQHRMRTDQVCFPAASGHYYSLGQFNFRAQIKYAKNSICRACAEKYLCF